MNIKFDKLVRVDGQKADGSTWVAYKISGNRLDGKGHWESGNIFDNKYNKKLLEELNEFEQGEKIKVSHEKNSGGFWQITGVKLMTEEEVAEAENPTPRRTGSSGSTGGTGRSMTWNGRTGEAYDRSASVYLAYDMIKDTHTEAELRKKEPAELLAMALELAGMVNNYIHDGEVVAVLTDDDALTPPNV